MMMRAPSDYRQVLLDELEARCSKNGAYSLRAFARDLEIQPSKLSEALNKKRGLSAKTARKIALKLGFNKIERERFVALVEKEHGRSKASKTNAGLRLKKLSLNFNTRQIELENFRVISDWYHNAIVDLTRLQNFSENPAWIAERLSITPLQASQAIKRLLDLGLLVRNEKGLLCARNTLIATPNDISSKAIKQYHGQMITKAQKALMLCPVEKREFSSLTMAIDESKIQEAKEMLREFRRKFCNDLEKSSLNKSHVYALTLQFFPLTRLGDSHEKNL